MDRDASREMQCMAQATMPDGEPVLDFVDFVLR